MAMDTVEAAVAASGVAEVVVVTGSSLAAEFAAVGAVVVIDPGSGLDGAVARGLQGRMSRPTAVLLGDLPSLAPVELASALESGSVESRGAVPDYLGTGTTLLTARAGLGHFPAFGEGSFARHLRAGYAELPVPAGWGLRRDVDSPEELAALPVALLGQRTASLIGSR